MTPLESQLERLASVPRLLVASDYDGVLAPIVEEPSRAVALPQALDALRRLAATEQTDAAVVSGRARADLTGFLPGMALVHTIGCHGAEGENGLVAPISADAATLVER